MKKKDILDTCELRYFFNQYYTNTQTLFIVFEATWGVNTFWNMASYALSDDLLYRSDVRPSVPVVTDVFTNTPTKIICLKDQSKNRNQIWLDITLKVIWEFLPFKFKDKVNKFVVKKLTWPDLLTYICLQNSHTTVRMPPKMKASLLFYHYSSWYLIITFTSNVRYIGKCMSHTTESMMNVFIFIFLVI